MNKPMLTVDELIVHMKEKGILFTVITEDEAKSHLEAHNNYFKLTSYRKNYTKKTSGINAGKYENLEFAYLRELARIDTELRHILLDMALDIEHFLKVALIKAVEDNKGINNEDGYKIVINYLSDEGTSALSKRIQTMSHRAGSVGLKLNRNKNNPYCGGIVNKYQDELPIWAFVELISFGDLKELVEYYSKHTNWVLPVDLQSLDRVRQIRNACAHGNAIINDLTPQKDHKGKSNAPQYITSYIKAAGIGKDSAQKKLSNPRVSQIVHLLYVYDTIVTSKYTRTMRINQLQQLLTTRCCRNKAYFQKNALLTTTHLFFQKLANAMN